MHPYYYPLNSAKCDTSVPNWDQYCKEVDQGVLCDIRTLFASSEVFGASLWIVTPLPSPQYILEINPSESKGEYLIPILLIQSGPYFGAVEIEAPPPPPRSRPPPTFPSTSPSSSLSPQKNEQSNTTPEV
jgi:hypothetical protein